MDENIFTDFDEKRAIGENDSYICKLIRNDSVEDFVSYITRSNTSLSSLIKPSIFETNPFLIKNKDTTLIEYAAFFGSIQIFQYLRLNQVKMNPRLLKYSIHGKNGEIIHLLEENDIKPNYSTFCEAIKCHHNDIANYIQMNFLNEKKK